MWFPQPNSFAGARFMDSSQTMAFFSDQQDYSPCPQTVSGSELNPYPKGYPSSPRHFIDEDPVCQPEDLQTSVETMDMDEVLVGVTGKEHEPDADQAADVALVEADPLEDIPTTKLVDELWRFPPSSDGTEDIARGNIVDTARANHMPFADMVDIPSTNRESDTGRWLFNLNSQPWLPNQGARDLGSKLQYTIVQPNQAIPEPNVYGSRDVDQPTGQDNARPGQASWNNAGGQHYVGDEQHQTAVRVDPGLAGTPFPHAEDPTHRFPQTEFPNLYMHLWKLKANTHGFRNGLQMHDPAVRPGFNQHALSRDASQSSSQVTQSLMIPISRLKLYETNERFLSAAECTYQKLRFKVNSPSNGVSEYLRNLYSGFRTLDNILTTGFDALLKFWDGFTPTVLKELYCFLHVVYAMWQARNPARATLDETKFIDGIVLFKGCLSSQPAPENGVASGDQYLFDEIMRVIWGRAHDGPASNTTNMNLHGKLWHELLGGVVLTHVNDFLKSLSDDVGTVFSYLCGTSRVSTNRFKHGDAEDFEMRYYIVESILLPLASQDTHNTKKIAGIAHVMLQAGFLNTIRELEVYLIGLIKVRQQSTQEFRSTIISILELCQNSYRLRPYPARCTHRSHNDSPGPADQTPHDVSPYNNDNYLNEKSSLEEAWYAKNGGAEDADALQGDTSLSMGMFPANGHYIGPPASHISGGPSAGGGSGAREAGNPSRLDKGKQVVLPQRDKDTHTAPSTASTPDAPGEPVSRTLTPESQNTARELSPKPKWKCTVCSQSFSFKSNCNRHMKTVHRAEDLEQQVFYCPIEDCKSKLTGYRGEGNLKTHMQRCHSGGAKPKGGDGEGGNTKGRGKQGGRGRVSKR